MKRSGIQGFPVPTYVCPDHHPMVQFRRNRVPGGTYFFTVTLRDRRSHALTDHIGPLREVFGAVRAAPTPSRSLPWSCSRSTYTR